MNIFSRADPGQADGEVQDVGDDRAPPHWRSNQRLMSNGGVCARKAVNGREVILSVTCEKGRKISPNRVPESALSAAAMAIKRGHIHPGER
jgi:hypothetical protein